MSGLSQVGKIVSMLLMVSGLAACADNHSEPFLTNDSAQSTPVTAGGSVLYVASGACYGGGVATSTGSAIISKFDSKTGQFLGILVDYNSFSPGDQPVGVIGSGDKLYVGIENTSGRRIDVVKRDGSGIATYLVNSTALNAALRGLTLLPDASLLVSRTSAVEKFSAARARVTQGTNPYISAPGGTCATSTTLISSTVVLPNGKLIFSHAGATPNNKLGVVAATGYAVAADCLSATTAPSTTALPSAMIYHSSGRLLVAYGSTTLASNFIYAYDVNATTGALSAATVAYFDPAVVNGPTALVEDPATGDVLVANGLSTFNTIERFAFDSVTKTLTKVGSLPIIAPSVFTKCVSGMWIGN